MLAAACAVGVAGTFAAPIGGMSLQTCTLCIIMYFGVNPFNVIMASLCHQHKVSLHSY
jgi:hypothetical protein